MPDLDSLSPDQRLALKTAAANLADEFAGVFGTETVELFLQTSYDQFADRAKFTHFLPLMAERFARQRLNALAKIEGKADHGCRRRLRALRRRARPAPARPTGPGQPGPVPRPCPRSTTRPAWRCPGVVRRARRRRWPSHR